MIPHSRSVSRWQRGEVKVVTSRFAEGRQGTLAKQLFRHFLCRIASLSQYRRWFGVAL